MFPIGSLVNGLTPNTRTNMLAAFQDQRLTVWAFPAIAFADRDLLGLTMIHVGAEADLGRSALIVRQVQRDQFNFATCQSLKSAKLKINHEKSK